MDLTPLLEVFNVRAQTRGKAKFIECERVEQTRNGEYLLQAFFTQRVALLDDEFYCGRPRSLLLECGKVDSDRRNVLGSHLMKLRGDPPPLF